MTDSRPLVIGFIGNFLPYFSTENERRKAFEELGHTVVTFQENQVNVDILRKAADKLDVLFYSHTHDPNYVITGLKDFFAECKENGLPTVSVHLDRWAWLKRVEDVGQEATWFTEYIFMADFSPEAQELYQKFGLNAHYLPAAVASDQCVIGTPKQEFLCDVVFTGSKGYHPEYPFRRELVDFLAANYNFKHYGNDGIRVVRGRELNDVYASAKVVIGDSCFGGRPYYVSDRYYEVRGRGGFLVHPWVEGVDHVGVANYKAGSIDDLRQVIDYYLTHEEECESLRQQGFVHVAKHETYTNRAIEMLRVIFGLYKDEN